MMSYKSYVEVQRARNPSLANLCNFLASPTSRRQICRIKALDFFDGSEAPVQRNVDDHSIAAEFSDYYNTGKGQDCKLLGRLLVIEDLTTDIIEEIGSALKVDPVFFASHIGTHRERSLEDFQAPDLATLPSREKPHTYNNVHYHRSLAFHCEAPPARKFLRDANVPRKVVLLPSILGRQVGLARHCVSTLRTIVGQIWICIVLVDPPVTDTYIFNGGRDKDMVYAKLPSQLLLGGYEDFLDPPLFNDKFEAPPGPTRLGLFDDLSYYWSSEPLGFHRANPKLWSLSFYQLEIVAGEWVKYIAVMQSSIKQYEYLNNKLPSVPDELNKLYSDLRALQSWRRRSMLSQHKINANLRFLKASEASDAASKRSLALLLKDYEYIADSLKERGGLLENMLPVVTSLVQIVDSRRAYAETANITRLTILALIFVPLTYVSSLFSMNSTNGPGGSHFWVYFVVAIPVTGLVLVVASPSTIDIRSLWRAIRNLDRRCSSHESSEKSCKPRARKKSEIC